MAAPTVNITCTASDQNGNPVAFARYVAKLNQTEIYQGFIVVEQVEVLANAQGVAVLALFPNALGVAGSLYKIKAYNPDTGGKFLDTTISVPNMACNLHDILVQAPYPTIDAAQQAVIAAQGIYLSVTGQTAIATTQALNAANAAIAAAASVVTASTQASNASGSATASAASAATVGNQATNVSTSATAAASAQVTATAQAVTATTQALNSAASAASASTQATNASGSATAASGSATTAGTQATNAAASAATATTQATNAASSSTTAATAQVTATTQAVIASSQATNAQASAGSASTQASLAATSATASQSARDAAIIGAGVYITEALGRAAVADGAAFKVQGAGDVAAFEYRRTNSAASVLIATYPSKAGIDALGVGNQFESETDLSFALVDAGGRRTWLEADLAGKPTDNSALKIGEKLSPVNTPALLTAGQQEISAENDAEFGFVDVSGRRTDFEIGKDGHFTQRVIDYLAGKLLSTTTSISGPGVASLGDSLTAGAGGTPYPTVLASLTGRTVTNLGVGGETSATIAGRYGSRPMLVTVSGGSIPASGGVTVTLAGDGDAVNPLQQGSAGINPCSVSGIVGTLSFSAGVFTFTRSAAGSAVPVNFPKPLITEASLHRRGDILIMWSGQNDGTNDATDIIARHQASIQFMSPFKKSWLVLGLSTSTAAFRAPMELQFLRAFGRRFVNVREYLSSAAAMADAGLTPTAGDLTDMANGAVPLSLRSDATHLNTSGYTVLAGYINQRLIELGFI